MTVRDRNNVSQSMQSHIHGGWYTDTTLAPPWSTGWDDWSIIEILFADTVRGRLNIERFKDAYMIRGTVEPLAHLSSTCGMYFLFTAGDRYLFWADGRLTVDEKEFASPKEFVDGAMKGAAYLPQLEIPQLESVKGPLGNTALQYLADSTRSGSPEITDST
ncbi:hypothetical protein DFH08DRAFT_801636 [Mycena albidolilacea]|uniref:Uncharacterized protein n=1 Tax=Mycena albidolilacea TaxID=1033008 RepID=A0AAD7AIY6_9AGAR|nr:hypothetical protein DFH08DRAFT_801636 [Mycena albidolilacea]